MITKKKSVILIYLYFINKNNIYTHLKKHGTYTFRIIVQFFNKKSVLLKGEKAKFFLLKAI